MVSGASSDLVDHLADVPGPRKGRPEYTISECVGHYGELTGYGF